MSTMPPLRCEPVDLDAMLAAREQRVERQRAAMARFGLPVVSVTLVMPGPVKDTPSARFAMQVASDTLDALFRRQAWTVAFVSQIRAATGAEALYAVAADALDLKRALIELENSHPLGRLWDLDVICPTRGAISRGSLGEEARRCLICDEPGHACARSRRHPLIALMAGIEEKINAYRGRFAS
jgi:holo-ACP synthase